jgi:CHC2 zinc finger
VGESIVETTPIGLETRRVVEVQRADDAEMLGLENHRYHTGRLSDADLVSELDWLERQRAMYAGTLAARDFAEEPEAVLPGIIAYYGHLVAEAEREMARRNRAAIPAGRGETRHPDTLARFERARFADLVDLAQTLTGQSAVKTGAGRYRLACPFHDDDVPSLVIYPPGKGWYCFVCQTGGPDAASFAAAFYRTTQLQGLIWVEELCNVPGAT